MCRPLYGQQRGTTSRVCENLMLSLKWWRDILQLDLAELRPWYDECPKQAVDLFCDARGSPPHLGAVLLIDGTTQYTEMAVPPERLKIFQPREEGQILGLELLSIALGMLVFRFVRYDISLPCPFQVYVRSDLSLQEDA